MNYITLINSFWNLAMMNPLSTGQVSLYFALLHICNRSNWTEWFQAPNQVLSVLTGLSRTGILRARNELKQRGLIEFKERGTKATLYKLCTLSTVMSNSVQDETQENKSIANKTQERVQERTQENDTIANKTQDRTQKSVQDKTQEGVQERTQKSATKERDKEKQEERDKQNQKSISSEIPEKCGTGLPEGIPQKVLDDYIAQLNATGKMMTGPGLELLFKRLEQLAPGNKAQQTEILEQSTRNRWKDVYPLHRDEPKENQQRTKENPNRFHNFEQRETSYDALMLGRLKERLAAIDSDLPQTGEVKADEAG